MFGFRIKGNEDDMKTAQANILALMQGLSRLNQRIDLTNDLVPELVNGTAIIAGRQSKQEEKAEENEGFVAECLTNNIILYDRINELCERMERVEERLHADAGDGTDF